MFSPSANQGLGMKETTLTLHVDPALKEEFITLAKNLGLTSDDVLSRFMRDFIRLHQEGTDYEKWFREQVQAGLDSAQAGRLIPGDEVEAEFAARRAATRRKLHTGS
jgi:predicted transcriptional regulator